MAIIPELLVFLMGMLPISEVRGALPLGINVYGLPIWQVFILACLGNIIIIPVLLVVFRQLLKNTWIQRWAEKKSAFMTRYKRAGLMAFVAIPLPITGAWTACLIAVFLGIGFTKALLSISTGVLIAAVIVTCLCWLGWIGAIVAGVVLTTLAFAWLQRRSSIYA